MDWLQLRTQLIQDSPRFPLGGLRWAMAEPEIVVPHLLEELEACAANPGRILQDEAFTLHVYTMFLLAQHREGRALDPLTKLLSLPGETPYELFGDLTTEYLDRVLASLCGGDWLRLRPLIENPEVDSWVRFAAVDALGVLVATGACDRPAVMSYLKEQLRDRLEHADPEDEREVRFVTSLLSVAGDIHPGELSEEIARAFDLHLVDLFHFDEDWIAERAALTVDQALAQTRRRGGLITDAVADLKDWHAWGTPMPAPSPAPFARSEPKVGRNDPCPCGSGKKYKKCCLT